MVCLTYTTLMLIVTHSLRDAEMQISVLFICCGQLWSGAFCVYVQREGSNVAIFRVVSDGTELQGVSNDPKKTTRLIIPDDVLSGKAQRCEVAVCGVSSAEDVRCM